MDKSGLLHISVALFPQKSLTSTQEYLAHLRSHTKPYGTHVLGKEIIVFPNVMSPKYDWSSEFFITHLPDQKGKRFLEIGCGSGVISLFAGLQGAKEVVATDINQNAIENTKANFQKYNLVNAQAIRSDVFFNVRGKFDTICFNAPYHGNIPRDILEYGVSDPDYRALKLFLKDAHNYRNANGAVLLGFSNTGDVGFLHYLLIEYRWYVQQRIEKTRDGWTAYLYILIPIQFHSNAQKYIYSDDRICFEWYKKQLTRDLILKIGNGFGYQSYFLSLNDHQAISLDVKTFSQAINKDQILLYDGSTIPFPDQHFDTCICAYTLHHATDPERVFAEMVRVTKSRIIIIEEVYKNFFQKCDLVWNCWKTNFKASQSVHIEWDSYFSADNLRALFEKYNLTIIDSFSEPRRSFRVEGFVLEKSYTSSHSSFSKKLSRTLFPLS